jgi:trans-aconitate 2-methyltransferase
LSWSAQQYLAFEDERTRPARDLLAGVPELDARNVVDIGCGPGNSTELLAARFPRAAVSAIDSSADMIAAARTRLPKVRFEVADIQAWIDGNSGANAAASFDLILANAVLHWVPHHAALFPSLVAMLAPRGCLAVQMPDNLEEPAQSLMRKIAGDGPWSHKLASAGEARAPARAANWYYELLRAACARVDVWRTIYYHRLGDPNAIVEWFKGSGLRPFLEPLDAEERAEYLRRYADGIKAAYPPLADGAILLPFPRLFVIAIR